MTELKIKIFADGADRAGMLEMYRQPLIRVIPAKWESLPVPPLT